MRAAAYYNEHDADAAARLRALIDQGLLPAGEVDERDIRDVAPADLVGFTHCHFFAGVGVWPLALRAAGWPDDRPTWTGSCPCQPFTFAGAKAGFADERHLWPDWHWLIAQARPLVVLGEQVSSGDARRWLDLVSDDLGGAGYALGAVDTNAAGHGVDWRGSPESDRLERAIRDCPDPLAARWLADFAGWADQGLGLGGFHNRQRLYFVAVDDTDRARTEARLSETVGREEGRAEVHDHGGGGLLPPGARGPGVQLAGRPEAADGWADPDWLLGRDREWRPVEPGASPLAASAPGRVGRLRSTGNALDLTTAAAFVRAADAVIASVAA